MYVQKKTIDPPLPPSSPPSSSSTSCILSANKQKKTRRRKRRNAQPNTNGGGGAGYNNRDDESSISPPLPLSIDVINDGSSDSDDEHESHRDFESLYAAGGLDRILCGPNICARSHMQFLGSIATSGLLATGIMMVFVGLAVFDNGWWAAFVFIGYSGAALAHMFFRKNRKDDQYYRARESAVQQYEKAFRDAAYVTLGAFSTSSVILPLFLAHNSFITFGTLLLTSIGTAMIYGAALIYISFFEKPLKDDVRHGESDESSDDDFDEDEDDDELDEEQLYDSSFSVFDARTFGCVLSGAVFISSWWLFIDGVVSGQERHHIDYFRVHFVLPGIFSTIAFVMLNVIRLEQLITFGAIIDAADARHRARQQNTAQRRISYALFLRAWAFFWFTVLFTCICSAIWIMVANYPHAWAGYAIIFQPVVMFVATCTLLYARKPVNMPEDLFGGGDADDESDDDIVF